MMRLYKLVGHEAVRCVKLDDDWIKSFSGDRIVARDQVGDVLISTVFLGMDHNWHSAAPPQLFETAIFGECYVKVAERCATWEQAEKMHARVVAEYSGR